MILDRSLLKPLLGSAILPQGDRYEVPPGRGQFRLKSLFVLLTAGALIATMGKSFGFHPLGILALEVGLIAYWWRVAQLREETKYQSPADQEPLRVEVRRWLQNRQQS